jgi:hypothetical protein
MWMKMGKKKRVGKRMRRGKDIRRGCRAMRYPMLAIQNVTVQYSALIQTSSCQSRDASLVLPCS